MSRFAEPQDPDFASINRSLDFDRRLWPYDVAQSRALCPAMWSSSKYCVCVNPARRDAATLKRWNRASWCRNSDNPTSCACEITA